MVLRNPQPRPEPASFHLHEPAEQGRPYLLVFDSLDHALRGGVEDPHEGLALVIGPGQAPGVDHGTPHLQLHQGLHRVGQVQGHGQGRPGQPLRRVAEERVALDVGAPQIFHADLLGLHQGQAEGDVLSAAAVHLSMELRGKDHVAVVVADTRGADETDDAAVRQLEQGLRYGILRRVVEDAHGARRGVDEGKPAAVVDPRQVAVEQEDVLVGQKLGVAVADVGQDQGALVEETQELLPRPGLGAALVRVGADVELGQVQVAGHGAGSDPLGVEDEEALDCDRDTPGSRRHRPRAGSRPARVPARGSRS